MADNKKEIKVDHNYKRFQSISTVVILLAVIVIVAIVVGVIIMNMPKEKPEEVVSKYFGYINDKNYDAMYEMLNENSKSMISKEDFITRNKNIYEGIDSANIKIEINEKVPWTVDGEYAGNMDKIYIENCHEAIELAICEQSKEKERNTNVKKSHRK